MENISVVILEGKIYSCKHCGIHLALSEDIISKSFHCRNGKAYFVNNVVNVIAGEKEDRMMIAGMLTVADISCVRCGSVLGWKRETAYEESQKFREGKWVLDLHMISSPDEADVGGGDTDNMHP